MHKLLKILLYTLLALVLILVVSIGGLYLYSSSITLTHPQVPVSIWQDRQVTKQGSARTLGPNWFQKNQWGIYEMYVEGAPYNRGVAMGKLSDSLMRFQEEAFVNQLRVMIPSEGYMKFLKNFIALFNKNLDKHVPLEFQQEIFGISQAADSAFDFVAPAYSRMMNYHAAHDIGHAVQNMNLVACTSFGVWDDKAVDSSLTLGRNFDFYVGDAFAQNKIVLFVNPQQGIPFAIITWGGMTGAVSGMNAEGLTVTLNAAKSDIPTSAATPISIIAREILQYAGTIDEAFAVAKRRQSFVSESILVGSAKDNKTAIIEKTPDATVLYNSSEHNQLISTNHFQSDSLRHSEIADAPLSDFATTYRYARMEELLAGFPQIGPWETAKILRDQRGLHNKNIGMGNEKAVNQLIAHHGIIFQPQKRKFWISTAPFQLGTFIGYSLDSVFNSPVSVPKNLVTDTLARDSFLSNGFEDFIAYKAAKKQVQTFLKTEENCDKLLPDSVLKDLTETNPLYFEGYLLLGRYYQNRDSSRAREAWQQALQCELPSAKTKLSIQKLIKNLDK